MDPCTAISVLTTAAVLLGITFLVTASLPNSPVKELTTKALTLVACGVYIVSPVDLVPEIALGPVGLLDDLAAVVVALRTARDLARGGPRPDAAPPTGTGGGPC